jgi:hypothetical protein
VTDEHPDGVYVRGHDVSPDEGDKDYDIRYIKKMAETPEQLPPLVMAKEGSYGGGHRTAAWHEAGWTHAPAWIEQDAPAHHTAAVIEDAWAGLPQEYRHLENPVDGSMDWHHGTRRDFKAFDEEPDEDSEDWDEEGPEHVHWNTHLGQHWTSLRHVAENFARGKHSYDSNAGDGEGHVHTANLGIKNPKVYKSELQMDAEAFHHTWDGHDPENFHDRVCPDVHKPDHYIEDHESGDKVDNLVKSHYGSQIGGHSRWLSEHPESWMLAGHFKSKLEREGHDGVVYGNEIEGPQGHPCAITFHDHQIENLRRYSGEGFKERTAVWHLAAWNRSDLDPGGQRVFHEDDPKVIDHLHQAKMHARELENPHRDRFKPEYDTEHDNDAVAMKKFINKNLSDEIIKRHDSGGHPELEEWAHRGHSIDDDPYNGESSSTWSEGNTNPHGLIRHAVRQAIDGWAHSSSDHDYRSLAVQKAGANHFGLTDESMGHMYAENRSSGEWDKAQDHYEAHAPFYHHFLDAMYKHTQEALKDKPYLLLHRGHSAEDLNDVHPDLHEEGAHHFQMQPLSSWTSSHSTANAFAGGNYGHKFTSVVPREHVLSLASRSGIGCLNEEEAVVIGGHGYGHVAHMGDGWTAESGEECEHCGEWNDGNGHMDHQNECTHCHYSGTGSEINDHYHEEHDYHAPDCPHCGDSHYGENGHTMVGTGECEQCYYKPSDEELQKDEHTMAHHYHLNHDENGAPWTAGTAMHIWNHSPKFEPQHLNSGKVKMPCQSCGSSLYSGTLSDHMDNHDKHPGIYPKGRPSDWKDTPSAKPKDENQLKLFSAQRPLPMIDEGRNGDWIKSRQGDVSVDGTVIRPGWHD